MRIKKARNTWRGSNGTTINLLPSIELTTINYTNQNITTIYLGFIVWDIQFEFKREIS